MDKILHEHKTAYCHLVHVLGGSTGGESGSESHPIVTSGPDATTTAAGPRPTAPYGYARTVILMQKQTAVGQDLFIRGGLDHDRHPG